MKKFKKSTLLLIILFVYVTAMAIYFLPRNTEISDTEKYVTLGASYVILLLLWLVRRRKEKLAAEREEDMKRTKKED